MAAYHGGFFFLSILYTLRVYRNHPILHPARRSCGHGVEGGKRDG